MTPSEDILPLCPYCGYLCPVGYGKCHCGCGAITNQIPQSESRRGIKKGNPYKYLLGHGTRKSRKPPIPEEIDGNNCYRIDLGGGKTSIVDACDLLLVNQFPTWYPMWAEDVCGYYAAARLHKADGKKITILMHRLILGLEIGDIRKADHKEPSKTLDNRRINLRIANDAESVRNRRKQKNNTSGFRGVSFCKANRKWRARIKVDRKEIMIGYFDTPEEAHAAYCEEARKHFGEFARFD